MREVIVYLLIGFFLNRLYNFVKREFWIWWCLRQSRLIRKRYCKPPQIDIPFPFPKGMHKLPNNEGYEFEMQGLPLPEGAEDFDLKGFKIDPSGKVTGNWTQ